MDLYWITESGVNETMTGTTPGPNVYIGKGHANTHPLVWQIEKLRVTAGMSQSTLSEQMGNGPTTWTGYVNTHSSLSALRAIERALGVFGKTLVVGEGRK